MQMGRFRGGKPRPALESLRAASIACLLLGALLGGCAVRAPHPDEMEIHSSLPERTVKRLISVWEQRLGRYVSREGGGDPAVLAQTRVLHSRDVLRPARITFDVLDADTQVPSRDGWDLEGVLIGRQTSEAHNWYVFLVGIVARSGYRPLSIEDIRLVGFSTQGGHDSWTMSTADHNAVRRYWETFRASPAIRFPGQTDEFVMDVEEDQIRVRELRSGAAWSLRRGAESSLATRD
jgi:hypothetical protein